MSEITKKQFLTEFLRNRKEIGALAPSSRFLVRKILQPIPFEKVECVVELGPGEGAITRELLQRVTPETQVFIYEMNRTFCETLRPLENDRVHIKNTSAEHLERTLAAAHVAQVDAVISSLPFSVMPDEVVDNILKQVKNVLAPGGVFLQYQYSLGSYKELKAIFSEVEVGFTPLNIPPAFVYRCYL